MKKTLALGKVAYSGTRRINAVELEFELRTLAGPKMTVDLEPIESYTELSICGSIWNESHTDIVAGGQVIDTIERLFPSKRVRRIVAIWRRWHLNGMKAGTRAQNEAVDAFWADKERDALNWYDPTRVHLKTLGLLDDRGYRYGTAWLVEPLPAEIAEEVAALFTREKAEA